MADSSFRINRGITLNGQAGAPSNPTNGDIYYDSTQGTFAFYDNGFWINLASRQDVASAASLTSSNFTASILAASLIRITGTTAGTIHGLAASTDGNIVVLYNNTNQLITVAHQSGTESTAANRIVTHTAQSVVIPAGMTMKLVYDSSQSRWVFMADAVDGHDKLLEDRNILLTQGGLITYTGTQIQFTEALKLELNQREVGGSPIVIDLTATTRSVSATGRMVYAVIDRTAGTAIVTDDATSLPAAVPLNQEVFLIAKRDDAPGGTQRIYFRNGFSLSAGQTARIGQGGTVFASEFTIVDPTDTTKKIVSSASGATTGKTLTLASTITNDRTLTYPDITDTIVSRTNTEALSNKQVSLSSTTDSTTTGSNTTLASFTTGVVRLTNASLASVSGIPAGTSGQLLIIENKTGTQININNEETTATAANRIQTGTGAAVSMANNASFLFTYDSTTSRWQLTAGSGSGSNSSGINYILNPNAEADTSGWATYKDAAGTTPVDGTGGSPTITWTRSTSSPLRGTASFLLTKTAANLQGEGVSYDFTIDSADQARVLSISFDYAITSDAANYATENSLYVYIYDVTNGLLIEPAGKLIQPIASGVKNKHIATFQTSSNSTSYRLIIHEGALNALAWTFQFDNFQVGPQIVQQGTPVTDWIAYTPTGGLTGGTYTGWWRRVGDSMEVIGKVVFSGAPTGASLTVSLPTGYTVDASKIQSTDANESPFGYGLAIDTGVQGYAGINVSYFSATAVLISASGATATYVTRTSAVTPTVPFTFGSTDSVTWRFIIPIVGWSSNAVVSSDTDTRVVAAAYYASANNASSSTQSANFDTKIYDTHGAVTASAAGTGTWKFTAPVPGYYRVSGTIITTANTASSYDLYKNGSIYQDPIGFNVAASGRGTFITTVFLLAGDFIDLRLATSLTIAGGSLTSAGPSILIERMSGPSLIMASETVSARYYSSTTGITGSDATITFATKDYDSHGAYSSGTFTVPVAGKYLITANLGIPGTYALNSAASISIYKNGSIVSENLAISGGAETVVYVAVTDILNCLAGDLITIRARSNATGPSIVSSNSRNYVSISKQGF